MTLQNKYKKCTFLLFFSPLPTTPRLEDNRIGSFLIKSNILVAQLNDIELNKLLQELFKISNPKSFQIEELPVEETMRSFFEKPENYL